MLIVNGKGYWIRVVGSPVENKFKPGINQWSFDLSIDETTQEKLLKAGMRKSYLKNKGDERGTFISFSRDATKADKTAGKPYNIIDHHGNPWSDELIGNGSTLNVMVSLNERSYNGMTFLKPSAIKLQVYDHVKYEAKGFPTKQDSVKQEKTEETW